MSIPVEVLAEEVLRLSSRDRADLLDQVVTSLDRDRSRDDARDALAARRDEEIESGDSRPMAGAALIARLRSELE